MCFSAGASFTAGVVLTGGGVCAHVYCRSNRDRILASMPLLFGFQQVVEGAVWLSLQLEGPKPIERAAAFTFCMVTSLWPTIFPLSLVVRQQDRIRKSLLTCLLVLGVATTGYLVFFLCAEGISARIHHHSVRYEGHLPHEAILRYLYMFIMAATGLLSRYWSIRIVGVSTFLSCIVSMYFYTSTFLSVWCFFGAWISFCIVMHLRCQKVKADDQPRANALVDPSV